MKYFKIKNIIPIVAMALTVNLTSCVNDLNVTPIDPSVSQTFNQDGVFAKLYASFALTGQEGPSGSGDVAGIDEGTSSFIRLLWTMNELSTDEAICSWGDPGIPELNFNRWDASHDQINGLYSRLYFNVSLNNHFLSQTKDLTDDKTVRQRAESRFLRAVNYYYLMDMFGNIPFTEEVSSNLPTQISRADLFAYVEKELLAAANDMYTPKTAPKYRVDQAAAWLMLSRLYLNAKVFTGTDRSNDAAIYAKKVIDSPYQLSPSYKHIFMGDNDVNDAKDEIIFAVAQDGINTKTWGASLFVIASTHTNDMPAWGTTEGWGGNRARSALVKKFFPSGIPSGADLTNLTTAAADDRALLFGQNRSQEISSYSEFKQGFSISKFSNVYVSGKTPNDPKFVDMDFPFMRKAEAYLNYAEAVTRGGAVVGGLTALSAVNSLRTRAHATALTTVDLPTLLDERSREFFAEGYRRSDLIRFGNYGNSDYTWDWKGGSKAGTKFSVNYNLFPIPTSDLNANPNLKQNPGY